MNRSASAEFGSDANQLEFTETEFNQVRELIYEMTGINMGESKRQLLYRRLAGRIKVLGMDSFSEYLARLRSGDDTELEVFTNSITTNLTSFFREQHHFDYLSETIIPELLRCKRRTEKRLRIWSAGCSTGEEPYSIAATLRDSIPDIASWDAKLLCTDIDSDVLNKAQNGIYAEERIEKVPDDIKKRWFQHSEQDGKTIVQVNRRLKEIITFKQLNLMHEWPMKGPFDVIFCRNVVIYFDKKTQRVLVDRFADLLDEGGHLVLGHSESLHEVSDRFELIGKTIYKKIS